MTATEKAQGVISKEYGKVLKVGIVFIHQSNTVVDLFARPFPIPSGKATTSIRAWEALLGCSKT